MVGHAHLRQEVVVVSLVHMNNVEHTHWPSRSSSCSISLLGPWNGRTQKIHFIRPDQSNTYIAVQRVSHQAQEEEKVSGEREGRLF